MMIGKHVTLCPVAIRRMTVHIKEWLDSEWNWNEREVENNGVKISDLFLISIWT